MRNTHFYPIRGANKMSTRIPVPWNYACYPGNDYSHFFPVLARCALAANDETPLVRLRDVLARNNLGMVTPWSTERRDFRHPCSRHACRRSTPISWASYRASGTMRISTQTILQWRPTPVWDQPSFQP